MKQPVEQPVEQQEEQVIPCLQDRIHVQILAILTIDSIITDNSASRSYGLRSG
jgi:hypothetical protein